MLFIGDPLETPAFGAWTRIVKTKNKRLEIRGSKTHSGKAFGEAGCCDPGSLQRLIFGQGEFYSCAVCF